MELQSFFSFFSFSLIILVEISNQSKARTEKELYFSSVPKGIPYCGLFQIIVICIRVYSFNTLSWRTMGDRKKNRKTKNKIKWKLNSSEMFDFIRRKMSWILNSSKIWIWRGSLYIYILSLALDFACVTENVIENICMSCLCINKNAINFNGLWRH